MLLSWLVVVILNQVAVAEERNNHLYEFEPPKQRKEITTLELKHPQKTLLAEEPYFEFVSVLPGFFLMGSPNDELGRLAYEKQHLVHITKPFEIQTTEVTQGLWLRVMGQNPSYHQEGFDHHLELPVENVSYRDVKAFIEKLNALPEIQKSKYRYRLPTEAEWEYAARGGNSIPEKDMRRTYSFGNNTKDLKYYANYERLRTYSGATHKVKDPQLIPNPLLLHHIHGNVWEWVEDAIKWDYEHLPVQDPVYHAVDDREARVVRGGGCTTQSPWDLRTAMRQPILPHGKAKNMGFRLVRTIKN